MEPHALALGSDGAAGSESVLEKLKVRGLEEGVGWAHWVRGVSDDDIVSGLVVLQPLEAVTDVEGDLGALEALGHLLEVELGDARDCLVDINKDGFFDRRVLEDLSKDAAIATTNDENALGVRVGCELPDIIARVSQKKI